MFLFTFGEPLKGAFRDSPNSCWSVCGPLTVNSYREDDNHHSLIASQNVSSNCFLSKECYLKVHPQMEKKTKKRTLLLNSCIR